MKKRRLIGAVGRAVFLATLAVLFVAIPVLAYTYYATIQVTETGGNAYTYLPLSDNINNLYLAQNDYISDNALDTRVLEGLTPLQHLVAGDRVMFVAPSVAAHSVNNYRYTMGNALGSDFPIVVGYNGYVTIDDAPALELGNNFKLDVRGYVDTSAGGNKCIVDKYGAFRLWVSGADNITAGRIASGNISPYSSTSDGWIEVTNAVYVTARTAATGTADNTSNIFWVGQTFLGGFYSIYRGFLYFDTSAIPDNATILSATLRLRLNADFSATDFFITIQNGQPTYPHDPMVGTDYNMTYYSDNGGWFSTLGIVVGYNNIVLNSTGLSWVNLTGTTKFCIRSSRDISGNAPAGDEYLQFSSSEGANDPQLVVYYTYPSVSATATPVTSGIRQVVASDNTSHLSVAVYDGSGVLIDEDIVATAASVSDNTSDWVIDQNNVMPYMDYYKHYVPSTTLIAHYQPNTMVLGKSYTTGTATFTNGSANVTGAGTSWTSVMEGSLIWLDADDAWHVVDSVADATHLALTTNYSAAGGAGAYTMAPRLPDLQGASQNGAITWGTNPAGLTMTTSGLVSASQPQPSGGAIPEPEDIIPETEQPGWFQTPTGGDLSSEIFFPYVSWLSTAVPTITGGPGFTPYQIYLIIAIVIWFCVVGLCAWKIPHLLFAGIMGMAVAALFVAYHSIFPWWVLIISAFFLFATIVFERKPMV